MRRDGTDPRAVVGGSSIFAAGSLRSSQHNGSQPLSPLIFLFLSRLNRYAGDRRANAAGPGLPFFTCLAHTCDCEASFPSIVLLSEWPVVPPRATHTQPRHPACSFFFCAPAYYTSPHVLVALFAPKPPANLAYVPLRPGKQTVPVFCARRRRNTARRVLSLHKLDASLTQLDEMIAWADNAEDGVNAKEAGKLGPGLPMGEIGLSESRTLLALFRIIFLDIRVD